MNTLVNNCTNPKTLALFDWITENPHVNAATMSIDKTANFFAANSEIIFFGFEHAGLNFTAVVDVLSEEVEIFTHDVEGEIEHYGNTSFVALITFLEGVPHISDILHDESSQCICCSDHVC